MIVGITNGLILSAKNEQQKSKLLRELIEGEKAMGECQGQRKK
jgi:hypothetical protein